MHLINQTEETKDPYVSESSDLWIGNSKKETHKSKEQNHLSSAVFSRIQQGICNGSECVENLVSCKQTLVFSEGSKFRTA